MPGPNSLGETALCPPEPSTMPLVGIQPESDCFCWWWGWWGNSCLPHFCLMCHSRRLAPNKWVTASFTFLVLTRLQFPGDASKWQADWLPNSLLSFSSTTALFLAQLNLVQNLIFKWLVASTQGFFTSQGDSLGRMMCQWNTGFEKKQSWS